MCLHSLTPGKASQVEERAGLPRTSLTWIGKPSTEGSRNAMKIRSIFRSILQPWQTLNARPNLYQFRSAAAIYTSRACPDRAQNIIPSQWGSKQEANFFPSLNSQFSPGASPSAAPLLSLWSIASRLHSVVHTALWTWINLMPCYHALSVFLGGYFLKCSIWLMPPEKPLCLESFSGYCIDWISDGGWLFLYLMESTEGCNSILLLWTMWKITVQWGHVCIFPE